MGQKTHPAAIKRTQHLFLFAVILSYTTAWMLYVTWTHARLLHAIFRAITATTMLGVVLACLELPAYLGFVHYRRFWDDVTGNWRGPANEFEVDLELAWRRVPSLRMSGRPQGDIAQAWNMPLRTERQLEFTFNSRGFRTKETSRSDIILLGDSYVEGHLVSNDETCSSQLAELTRLAVGNFGQSGYGTIQELRVLELYGMEQKPHLIVWFFYEGNDLYDDQEFENNLVYFEQVGRDPSKVRNLLGSKRSSFRAASFAANAFSALRRACDALVPNQMPYFGWFGKSQGRPVRLFFHDDCEYPLGEYELERFEKTKAAFRKGRALCEQEGATLWLCFIPTKFRVYGDLCQLPESSPCRKWQPWNLASIFASFCETEGIPFFDLTGPLRDAAQAGCVLYYPADTHWNQAGHSFVARFLAEKLRQSGRSFGSPAK
jgi:hypothetical protein